MAPQAFTISIVTPAGEKHTIPVKPSTLIALEETWGVPFLERIRQGYTRSLDRLGFAVGQDAKVIPATMTFADFVDSDDTWEIDFEAPPMSIPASVDATTEDEVAAVAGEA